MNCVDFPKAMVSMAQNRTLPEVLRAIVTSVAACKNVVATCIWLIEPGDPCATCRFRPKCPDQSRCLHFAASAGNFQAHPQDLAPTDIAFGRLPLGIPKIGKVAATGEPLLLPALSANEDWIADADWFESEGVTALAVHRSFFAVTRWACSRFSIG